MPSEASGIRGRPMSWCKSRRGSTTQRTTGVNLDVSLTRHDKEVTPMVQHDLDPYELLDALRAGGDVDLIRASVELVLQALIEAAV